VPLGRRINDIAGDVEHHVLAVTEATEFPVKALVSSWLPTVDLAAGAVSRVEIGTGVVTAQAGHSFQDVLAMEFGRRDVHAVTP
jgi:hypothetical protein